MKQIGTKKVLVVGLLLCKLMKVGTPDNLVDALRGECVELKQQAR